MKLWIALMVGVSLVTPSPSASQKGRSCKGNPELVGSCFRLHGKVMYTNGTPSMRIWPVGTKRMLGILPSENEIIPDNLAKRFSHDARSVFADLEVCPFTKEKSGEMQIVCVESATHLVVKKD
jgi:hypothetical protein